MGFFDALFGRKKQSEQPLPPYRAPQPQATDQFQQQFGLRQSPEQLSDDQALARYRYMVQSAPPELIEKAHAEAFAKLTPEQRQTVLREMAQTLPPSETAHIQSNQPDPQTLARLATRAEFRNPGYMERTFGPHGTHGKMMSSGGSGMMGTIFGSMVAGFVGSMAAMAMFDALDNGLLDMPMEDPLADMGSEEFVGDFGGDFGGEEF